MGVALASGIVLIAVATAIGFVRLQQVQADAVTVQLQAVTLDAATGFQRSSIGAATAPAAIAGLFSGLGPDVVTGHTFAAFTEPLLDAEVFSALEWIPRLSAEDAAAFVARRSQEIEGFSLREFNADGSLSPAAGRGTSFPVAFVEPLEPNRAALGVDLGSSPPRARALEIARDSGTYVATAPITLAQGGTGVLIFHPAYASGAPHESVPERRAALLGFGLSVLRPSVLLDRVVAGSQFASVSYGLYDLGPASSGPGAEGVLLASHVGASGGVVPGPGGADVGGERRTSVEFDFAGRHMELVALAASAFGATTGFDPSWALIAAGTTAVLLLLVYGIVRRRADLVAIANTARLRSLVDASPDAFIGLDPAGRIVDWSPQADAVFRLADGDPTGRALDDLIRFTDAPAREGVGEEDEDSAARFEPLAVGATVRREGEATRGDGETFPVEVTMSAGPTHGIWPVVCFVRDATDMERARQERIRASRLEALGQLAAGVAHDFKNIIWGIDLVAGNMRSVEPTRESVAYDTQVITDAVAHGNALVAQLLDFARPRPPSGNPIDVLEVIIGLAPMLDTLLGASRRLVLAMEVEEARVAIDRTQLQEVLINLVANARDAISGTGTVTIAGTVIELDGPEADALDITPGPYGRITVTDTGSGIPPAVLQRIFEPYFTTKDAGKGTGLGLATAFGIIRGAEGAIEATSETGVGTTFRILLPIDESA